MSEVKVIHKEILLSLLIVFVFNLKDLSGNSLADDWDISIVPSSVRIDPVTAEIIEERFDAVPYNKAEKNLLYNNWIFDGTQASLHSARGEYVSFQLVLKNNSAKVLENIVVEMESFKSGDKQFSIPPELFLEWSVEVKTPSGGYPKSSLGKGWYPDALIPFEQIQIHKSPQRWIYPLQLPDFNNRIENQKSLMIWIDQYVPVSIADVPPGTYSSKIIVKIQEQQKSIPVNLVVWDFEIPNENNYRASLQHEGFLSRADENVELQIYQLLKKHRISAMDPTYKPGLTVSDNGEVHYSWDEFDQRLEKYFTGKAFTKEYGYNFGPGYGEPVENFLPPFDVYGKHDTPGWPDVGKPGEERNPENQKIYIDAIQIGRAHV